MFTAVQVINIGLSKIGSSQIERIDPPRSSLERFVSSHYLHWKRSELAKRRWVFARVDNYALAKTGETAGLERPYQYELPTDCVRPVRTSRTEWRQARRSVFSAEDGLTISYISDVDETEFDPLFVEVLACRIALECVEFVTQSNSKKSDAKALYDEAVAEAGRTNAYVIGPEDNSSDDNDFPFLTARY